MMLFSDLNQLERLLKPVKVYNRASFQPFDKFSMDSRLIKKGEGFIALAGKLCDGHDFVSQAEAKGGKFIISERDIAGKAVSFIVKDSYAAFKAVISYIRKKKNPFVYAVSGSVGKTTTKEILSFLLEDKYKVLKNNKTENNLLGVGKTILSLCAQDTVVLELGTNSAGEIQELSGLTLPDVGVVTFVKPVHLEGLKTLKGVFQEKISMFRVNPAMKAVLNKDDRYLKTADFIKKTYWFGKSCANDLYGRFLRYEQDKSAFLIQGKYEFKLPVLFPEFVYNVMAAALAAQLRGVSLSQAAVRMNNFKMPVCSRMQLQEAAGYIFFNDAYNANPFSFNQALKASRRYRLKKVAVVGDMLELGSRSIYYHKLLAKQVIKSGFEYCLAVGDYSRYLVARLKDLGYKQAYHLSSLDEAASFIRKQVGKGSLIFLKGSRKMELEKLIEKLS